MEVFPCKTKEEARTNATDGLNNVLGKISDPILFLSSGGSSLEVLEGLQIGENSMVSVLDERYSTDPLVSNFAQLFERMQPKTFIPHLSAGYSGKGAGFIDTRVRPHETLQQLAQRFERELRTWKQRNPHGAIVITQGMGADGHTAGIMPRYIFDNPGQWVAGYDARVTTTLAFLREMVDYSVAYVTGAKKREALKRLLAREGTLSETPARIMREMKHVKLFTDIVY